MKNTLLLWAPRVVGFSLTIFLGLFAFHGFSRASLNMNMLPALLVFVSVALAWRRPLIGAIAFVVLGVAYAVMARQRPDWILVISGPLAFAALLYLLSWLQFRQRPAP